MSAFCVFLMVQASARAQSKPSNLGAPARPVNCSRVIQPPRNASEAVFPRTPTAFEHVQTILLPARLQQRTREKRERQTLQQETRQDATGRVCKRPPAAGQRAPDGGWVRHALPDPPELRPHAARRAPLSVFLVRAAWRCAVVSIIIFSETSLCAMEAGHAM